MSRVPNVTSVPQEIAEAIVLPGGYGDLEGVVFPACDWLRANAPIAQVEVEGHDRVWLISKHQHNKEILRDAATFLSEPNNHFLTTTAGDDYLRSILGGTTKVIDNLTPMDGEDHRGHRAAQAEAFSIEAIRKYEPRFRELATKSVDRFLAAGGECDAVATLAQNFPLEVVMEMISVPESDFALMHKMTQETFGGDDPDIVSESDADMSPETLARLWQESAQYFYDYFEDMRVERLRCPIDDLSSAIVNGRMPDGELMSPLRQNHMLSSIALAGHDTVSSAIAGGIHGLATHPDQLALARQDPSLIPGLVDEALRWSIPAKHFMRTAGRDVDFHGQQIKAGDRIMCLFVSANRDEDVFPDPYRFDITRKPNPQLSFSFGPHICLGLHVTKIEMKALYAELVSRITSLELAGEPRLKLGNFVTGLKTLPVRYTPA
ncbi:unannotated protein [freshwater metagenome]|uniref:Unannotated protein n=1 Tax=freshwater metagenome TaxID=449393 RepID=A0A6J7L4C3_9ZZZZ